MHKILILIALFMLCLLSGAQAQYPATSATYFVESDGTNLLWSGHSINLTGTWIHAVQNGGTSGDTGALSVVTTADGPIYTVTFPDNVRTQDNRLINLTNADIRAQSPTNSDNPVTLDYFRKHVAGNIDLWMSTNAVAGFADAWSLTPSIPTYNDVTLVATNPAVGSYPFQFVLDSTNLLSTIFAGGIEVEHVSRRTGNPASTLEVKWEIYVTNTVTGAMPEYGESASICTLAETFPTAPMQCLSYAPSNRTLTADERLIVRGKVVAGTGVYGNWELKLGAQSLSDIHFSGSQYAQSSTSTAYQQTPLTNNLNGAGYVISNVTIQTANGVGVSNIQYAGVSGISSGLVGFSISDYGIQSGRVYSVSQGTNGWNNAATLAKASASGSNINVRTVGGTNYFDSSMRVGFIDPTVTNYIYNLPLATNLDVRALSLSNALPPNAVMVWGTTTFAGGLKNQQLRLYTGPEWTNSYAGVGIYCQTTRCYEPGFNADNSWIMACTNRVLLYQLAVATNMPTVQVIKIFGYITQ